MMLVMLLETAEKGGSTSDRPGKQMNRNAARPAEKGGHHQWQA